MNFNAAASNICNGGGDGDAMDELISAAITATKPHVEVPVPVSTLPTLTAPITIYDQERTKVLKNLKKAMTSLDEFHNRFKQGFKQNTNAWKCYMESLNWQMILINPNEDDNSSNSNKKKVLLEQQFSFYCKKMDDALKIKLGLMNRANNLSTKILDRFKLTTGALDVLATLPREGANLSEEEMFAALATLEHNEKINKFNRDLRISELNAEWNVLQGNMLESVKSVAVILNGKDIGPMVQNSSSFTSIYKLFG